jgi:hypothetical protein
MILLCLSNGGNMKENRVNQTNKAIPQKVWREAEKIAGGIYRMNAKYADVYAFNFNEKGICYGEFMSTHLLDDLKRLPTFAGYLKIKILL